MEPYSYFEVTADEGIVARGESIAEMLSNAAKATFGIMVRLEGVEPRETLEFEFTSPSLEELLLDFLTQLLALKDIHSMFFSEFDVEVEEGREGFKLRCRARGEGFRARHEVFTEVKAITYHNMEVKKNRLWEARFVVDV